MLIIVSASGLVVILDVFFRSFALDTPVDDGLCFCFPVALFFHDPAWDMLVDYCFYFSSGFIHPASRGGAAHTAGFFGQLKHIYKK